MTRSSNELRTMAEILRTTHRSLTSEYRLHVAVEIDRLAALESRVIVREDWMPADAVKWGKDDDGACYFACWPSRNGERNAVIAFDDAPDLRPDIEGPITRPVVSLREGEE